jgi:chromate reductase, NAD(P)H dehydrogenase (quinone)
MNKTLNILAFAGSLRKGSYNKMLLSAAVGLAPQDATIKLFDLEGIPPFNQDLEQSLPEKVKDFKAKIKAADAILIVTPEYNYSVPGVLKNAIDWCSRPVGDNSWEGKPVAIMSASTGMLGGARAQYHLRQIFVMLDMRPVNKPEIMVNFATQKFDEQGNLVDDKTKELIRTLLTALVTWTRRLQASV